MSIRESDLQRLGSSDLPLLESGSLACGWIGPPLEEGRLPALFYFALSLEDTLLTSPYNTPVELLHTKYPKLRIFSVTLPLHVKGQNEQGTVGRWIEALEQETDYFERFFLKLTHLVDSLLPLISELALGGLSRGAWIASHLAHRLNRATPLLLWAPMTRLLTEVASGNTPKTSKVGLLSNDPWDLLDLPLAAHQIWVSCGDRDQRIETARVVNWMDRLNRAADKCDQHHLVIYPSIGYKGHGTPDSIFKAGTSWLSDLIQLSPPSGQHAKI